MLAPGSVQAADYVGMYGSYYLENSTRVVSPMVQISKDLPEETELKVTYLIDQITSASAAFTPASDTVFQEFRHEVRAASSMRFLDAITPSLNVRYSDEPDYRSVGGGGALSVDLFDKKTTLALSFSLARDWIPDDPNRPTGSEELDRNLWTVGTSLGVTQILTKQALMGASVELQVLRGYQENQYRLEQHPRERERYAFCLWGAYRFPEVGTSIRLHQRLYTDTWSVVAFTTDLTVTQRIVRSLEIQPYIRFHIQSEVDFIDRLVLPDGTVFTTEDPKLEAFNAQTFGLRLSWKLSVLSDTALDIFEDVLIQPYYAYLRQTNRYGNAHMAQLGLFWPF